MSDLHPDVPTQWQDWARVLDFLDRLSPAMMDRLYEAPSTCLCIFRLLPESARHIVLNMIWYDEQISYDNITVWVRERKSDIGKEGERRHLTSTLTALSRLHIITERPAPPFIGSIKAGAVKERHEIKMNPRFRTNFSSALTGGGSNGSFGAPSELDDDLEVTPAFLDSYAESQWEMIQHFMVGSSISGIRRPDDTILKMLQRNEFMASSSVDPKMLSITSRGFQFLLQDINTQLWDLLLRYLEDAEDVVQVLAFLFMLGSLVLGKAYSIGALSLTETRVLLDLVNYGLVYRPTDNSAVYYPTRLATTLTSSAPPLVSARHADEERGFIVLETNYKIYAYTSNPLQIAVLNLFVHLKNRFSNFVTGQITRDSIRRGLSNGITASQIISYLTSRAHPQMRADSVREAANSVLPTTVIDQIRLWEQEGRRVQTAEGYLYDEFLSAADYELVANYARELGALLWETTAARKMFVTLEGHVQLREFIKRRSVQT